MTNISKSYRLRVATAGASVVAGNVAFTETVRISSVGEVGGQKVYPLASRTSARPWSVEVADVSEAITGQLGDADGRAHLLQRLADLSVSTDGGSSWNVLATGRIADIEMVGVSAYKFTMQDERLIERNTTIFKATNTTRIIPRGLENAWWHYQDAGNVRFEVEEVDATNNTTTYIGVGQITDRYKVTDGVIDLLDSDVVDDPANKQANFTLLRANIDGTDREVVRFNASVGRDPLKGLRARTDRAILRFEVAGYQDPGGVNQERDVHFHMPGEDPSDDLPLHIGGQEGIDPFTYVKNIYDGSYQASANPATVRYDSTPFSAYDATTNPHGLIDNPRFPKLHPRITGPENMAKHLEDVVYGPLGVTPFINAAGEVSPRLARLPAGDQVPNPDNLFEFDGTNSSTHPTWLNQGREQITVIEFTFKYARAPEFTLGSIWDVIQNRGLIPAASEEADGSDLLVERERLLTNEHDRVTAIRIVHEMEVRGIQDRSMQRWIRVAWALALFERFGDGPVLTRVDGLSAAESVEPGDWVTINLDSYPDLQTSTRGGKRLLQVIERVDRPEGPSFELLDAGPSNQPLTTPTVAVASNANDPNNAVDITISGLNAGESYETHVAVNATEPVESSPLWQYRSLAGDANETITLRDLPSGETIWVRARATASGRISSAWSTADSAATTGLTAPSNVAAIVSAGDEATLTWTNGESEYDIAVDLDGTFKVRLQAGATSYTFTGLSPSTTYTGGVKHVDDFGGESSRVTDAFTTDAVESSPPMVDDIRILVGEEVF